MAERLAKKVLLVGWDAADWKIIQPLLDAGQLPALESLVNRGVMGNLATLDPPMSPMLWTSIATGMHADKHGILGFTEPTPDMNGVRPVTITSRKVKAVWNILNQSGLRCNVVGWWPSHPAEPLDGVTVSNFYHRATGRRGQPWPLPPGSVHPPRLEEILAELRVHPEELTAAHLLPLVPELARVDQEKDRRLVTLAKIIAECSTVHAAATWVMENEPWEFMAVYYDAIDHFSHAFMHYHPPRLGHVSEEEFELYRGVVAGGYRYHDMMLKRLLQLAGPETTVLLVSDHGFHCDHLRPDGVPDRPAGPAAQHRQYGVVAMAGPHIRQDELIFGSTLIDVAPTILTLFGLPVGRDMDGRPLLQAFGGEITPEFIPSWEDVPGPSGQHPPDLREDPIANQQALRQLVELGYIDEPDADAAKAVAECVNESRFYLGRAYLNKACYHEALGVLKALHEECPEVTRYAYYLARTYEVLGRAADCRRVIEGILARGGESFPQLDLLQGILCFAERRFDAALTHLVRAESANPGLPYLHHQIGSTYLELGFRPLAERAFRKGLEIDPDCAALYSGLAACHLQQGKHESAADAALTAVGLLYHFPHAHLQLAKALQGLGEHLRAAEAGEVAVTLAPGLTEARRLLVDLYHGPLGDPEAAQRHRKILAKRDAAPPGLRRKGARKPLRMAGARGAESATGFPPADDVITVVSGLPRSGTSLMMHMLQAGGMDLLMDGHRVADQDNPRGYFEYDKVKGLLRDNGWLHEAAGRAVKIVAPLLHRLPEGFRYNVLFMERDLDEVLRSQQVMLNRCGRRAADPAVLTRAFREQTARALRWLEARADVRTLVVGYGRAVDDPVATASRVCGFLNSELRAAAMAAMAEPALYRQRNVGVGPVAVGEP